MADAAAPSDAPPEVVRYARDRARLCGMVEAYHDFAWRTLRRLGVAGADTDDATQQVFMVIYQKLERIDPAKERSFVYGVTVRVARAHRRRGRRHREVPLDDVEAVEGGQATPAAEAEAREGLRRLDALLAQVSFPLRVVFVLHEIEGMTLTEIAAALDIPRGTAASRLRRGRRQLREAAQSSGRDEEGWNESR
ncbi:MAG: sigma-70 family RNA polymerase sigma factor [Myxococcota bacterium]